MLIFKQRPIHLSVVRGFMRRHVPVYVRYVFLATIFASFAACSGTEESATTSPSPPSSASPIVAVGDGMRFGEGWSPVENFGGSSFRWAQNDAEIMACPDSKHRTVTLQLEPGPSLGSKAMSLTAHSAGLNRAFRITDRRPIQIELPQSQGVQSFVLHVDSKNLPVKNEKRILNFRVFAASLGVSGNCGTDIVPDGSPIKLGRGWYALETFNGATFRWVNNDAQIQVLKTMSNLALEMEAEAGPGMANKPSVLDLESPSGHVIASTHALGGRSYYRLDVGAVKEGDVLKLHVKSRGKMILGEPRVLNFRVFDLHVAPPK